MFMIGSSNTGFILRKFSRKQAAAAVWNALALLSTSGEEPALSSTRTPMTR